MTIQEMVVKINNALANDGYSPRQARATLWTKKLSSGHTIQRIYLNGTTAGGYVQEINGKFIMQDVKYMKLYHAIASAIK